MKDILIGTDASGQTVCIFRKNGMAIYGRWVDGQYQTEIVRRGDARGTPFECSLEAELDAELRTANGPARLIEPRRTKPQPAPAHLTGTQADIATRRRQRAESSLRCPLCRDPYARHGSHQKRRSRDHIVKRADGGRSFLHGDTINIRFVCQECNGLLNRLGQCPGAVACWIAVTRREWRAA